MIKSRTGADMEAWLLPQVRATASNMVMLDKVQAELEATESLVTLVSGSMAQMKNEVSPLLPYYDKMQRTLMLQSAWQTIAIWIIKNRIKRDNLTIEDYPEWVGGWAWVFWYTKIGLLTIGTIYVAYRFVSPLFDL